MTTAENSTYTEIILKRMLQPQTKPVETHYKNTYFFALTLTKMLTVAN